MGDTSAQRVYTGSSLPNEQGRVSDLLGKQGKPLAGMPIRLIRPHRYLIKSGEWFGYARLEFSRRLLGSALT
jgi:DMSO/TMAO reductase YedYZ molybdopterin-dependent catalytic subunit